MENKQTAVEWLIEQIQQQRESGETDLRTTLYYCEQAKAIEKEQMEASYNKAKEEFISELDKQILDFEHDYNRDLSQHKHFGGALFALNRLKFYLSQSPEKTK